MKGNWVGNTELHKYALASPPKAYVIVQAVNETASDIKDSKVDFDGADSLTGWGTLPDGGARPTGSSASAVAVSQADTADAITSLGGMTAASIAVPIIEWYGDGIETAGLDQLVAELDPNADGGGKVVDYWVAQLWRVAAVIREFSVRGEYWDLQPITPPITVEAGSIAEPVTFDFGGTPIEVGLPPDYPQGATGSALSSQRPTTVVVIEARDVNNAIASNVAWIGDTAASSETDNSHVVSRYVLTSSSIEAQDPTYSRKETAGVASNGLPKFELKSRTYTAQTITFSGAGNRLDLGAAPTNPVEFVVEGEQPGGSSLTAQARVLNGSTDWTTVQDGDLDSEVGLTGSTAGEYHIRATATPSTSGDVTATVRRLGVREIAITDVSDELREVGNPVYTLDPDTLKAGIPTMAVALRRDLRDYRDYATELFSENHAGQVEFRVMYGSTKLDRQYWLHLDNFRLRNYDSANDPIIIEAIHPLALTKQTIPVGSTGGQSSLTYSGSTDTTQSVYSNLLNEPNLAGRYKGVLLSSTSTVNVGKIISEPRPLKDELDRIAFIEGGAIIPSGGRLKWRRIFSTTGGFAPLAAGLTFFEPAEPVSVTPNLDRRIVSYRAPYNYSDALDGGRGGFANQSFQESTAARTKLGHAALGSHQDLEDETAKWLLGSTYASAIAERTVRARKQGMMVLRVRPDIPHPWVELGDPVVVPTDRFVGRSLDTDIAVRGKASFYGVVVEHDMQGTEFAVWVPEIDPWRQGPAITGITYDIRPIVDPPDFDVSVVRLKGATSGTAQLLINDPGKRLITSSSALQFRTRVGGSTTGAWTNWSSTYSGSSGAPGTDTSLARQLTVSTPAGLDGEFRWRANYTDPDGTARVYSTQERLANFDETSKTLRIPATDFLPNGTGREWTAVGSHIRPSTAGTPVLQVTKGLVLPASVTLDTLSMRAFAGATDSAVDMTLRRWTSTGGLNQTIVNIGTTGTGWQTVDSTGLAHVVSGTYVYGMVANISWPTTGGGPTKLAYVDLTYTAPDYGKTI